MNQNEDESACDQVRLDPSVFAKAFDHRSASLVVDQGSLLAAETFMLICQMVHVDWGMMEKCAELNGEGNASIFVPTVAPTLDPAGTPVPTTMPTTMYAISLSPPLPLSLPLSLSL